MDNIRSNIITPVKLVQRLCHYILLLYLVPFSISAQYAVEVEHKDIVNFCEPIHYKLDIEKLFNTTLDGLTLEVTFTEEIQYVSNSLGLTPLSSTANRLLFEYPDLQNCNLQIGEIVVQPKCYDVFTNLRTSFTLKTPFVCLSESEQRTVVKSPFVDIQFLDYIYDASANQLLKSIQLFNAGSVDIDQFYILPVPDQQFARLDRSDVGRISNDTIFIENNPLKSNDSLTLNLLLDLNSCDLRSIDYVVGFICEASSCTNFQSFIDENDIYQNQVSVDMEQNLSERLNSIQYNICDAYHTPVTIKNEVDQAKSSIADIYSLEFVVSPQRNTSRRFEECMVLTAEINDVTIPITKVSNTEYNVKFEFIGSDPDGIGGLDDLDGDGQYDDLPLGESLNFDLGLMLSQMCYDDFQNLDLAVDTELNYDNFCRERFTRVNGADGEGFTPGSEIAQFYRGSFPVIEALKINESNNRFIEEGDAMLLKYNLRSSPNMTRICETNKLQLLLDIPPTVVWDSSVEVLYYDEQDTSVVIPEVVNDSLLQIDFEEYNTLRSTIELSFISVCDLNNTNYDAALTVCEQCVEYDLPRFRAELSKICDVNCNISIPIWETVSAPFFTKCESLPELIDPVILGDLSYYNLSAGFIDDQETLKINPLENPSNTNNRFYFDGDTMLVQIPFQFDCADELSAFSIQIIENQLSTYKFDILSSDIVLLNDIDNSEINRCSANLFLNQSETAISFDFSASSFNLPCLDTESKHLIELRIKFTYDCVLNSNCGLLRLGVLQGLTQIQLQNGCTRRVFSKKDTVYIHEVFKEEFFRPIDFGFGPQSSEIFDQFIIKTPLYSGLFTPEEFEPEYKRRPILRSINYTLPEGFKVVSDFILVNSDFIFFNDRVQIFNDTDKIDTLLKMTLPSVENPDGSTRYSFTDDKTQYYSDQLGDGLMAGLLVKSVCNPVDDIQTFTVDGVVEYVDYANGSLDTVSFPFSQTQPLIFNPERFIVEDDFQILDTQRSSSWTINKQVDFFTFDNLINEDERESDEFIYRVKYSSKSMTIDSITTGLLVDQFLFDDTQEQIESQNTFIGDSIIDIELSPQLLFSNEVDSIFNSRRPTQFIFHTSDQSCGFDTLFFEIGRKAEFFQDTCNRDIYNDFFVSFSPPGFPQLEWTDVPTEINTYDTNRLGFTLSNIGQGDLINTKIVFENMPNADYGLQLIDSSGIRNLSNTIDFNSDLVIDLGNVNNGLLKGLSNLDLSTLELVLLFKDVCVNNQFFNARVKVISQSFCGDELVSPVLTSGMLPFIAEENLVLDLEINSFTREECLDTASVRISINTNSSQNLVNPELHVSLPKDLDSYSGTLSVNGISMPDPDSKLSDDNANTIFIVSQGLPTTISDSIVVEFKFDGSCIDVCRSDSLSAYLFSNLQQQCVDGNTSSPSMTRAYTVDQKIRWKPNLTVNNIQSSIVGTDQGKLKFELSGDIELTDTPLYGGDVSITVFGDLNQNTILDPTDIIVKQESITPFKFNNHLYSLTDTLLIDPAITCALHLIVDVNESCSCLFTSLPISQDGFYESSRTIQNCSPDPIDLGLINFDGCQRMVNNNPKISQRTDGAFVFTADTSIPSDTVRFFTDCMSCQFVEEIIIQHEESTVKIELGTTEDCSLSAQLLWNGTTELPDDLNINWNSTNEQTTMIQNPPPGLLTVQLTNESGCIYQDSITIASSAALQVVLMTDDPKCPADFPAIIDVAAEGADPLSIRWNDGVTTFQRLDIMPGMYLFTVTDGLGCTKIDTLNFGAPENLSIQSVVKPPDCFNTSGGSIEVVTAGQDMQYALSDQLFSSENTFDNLNAGSYIVYAQNDEGCIDSAAIRVALDSTFNLAIPSSQRGLFGDTLTLNPELIDANEFTWQWQSDDFELSCGSCSDPHIQLDKEGDVSLVVSNGICSFNRTINISAEFSDLLYIPNAISPSSAGGNDQFFIYPNASFDEVDLAIYDRWGNELYTVQRINAAETDLGWDGTVNGQTADIGVYVYKATVRRFADDLEIELLGDFLLIND